MKTSSNYYLMYSPFTFLWRILCHCSELGSKSDAPTQNDLPTFISNALTYQNMKEPTHYLFQFFHTLYMMHNEHIIVQTCDGKTAWRKWWWFWKWWWLWWWILMDDHDDGIIIIMIIHQKLAKPSGLNNLGSWMECNAGEFNMNSTCYG